MEYEVYHLPTNFTDAGRLFGMFEIRNAVETVFLTIPVLFLCIYGLRLSLMPKLIITLTLLVPLTGFGLIGINDDSLTRWLGTWVRWRKCRRVLTFRGVSEK